LVSAVLKFAFLIRPLSTTEVLVSSVEEDEELSVEVLSPQEANVAAQDVTIKTDIRSARKFFLLLL
jgi:hypothetical protein